MCAGVLPNDGTGFSARRAWGKPAATRKLKGKKLSLYEKNKHNDSTFLFLMIKSACVSFRLKCVSWQLSVIDYKSSWGLHWSSSKGPATPCNNASAAFSRRGTMHRYVQLKRSCDVVIVCLFRFCSTLTSLHWFQAELVATAGEFESYKVRVHNVLKQQKSKSTAQSEGDSGKIERYCIPVSWHIHYIVYYNQTKVHHINSYCILVCREQLFSQVQLLRTKLTENQQSLQSSTAELQQLHTEHDTLLERHNKILQETISKEAELRERQVGVFKETTAD